MRLDAFAFDLPERLIAQHPTADRDQSKLMVIWKKTGRREHHTFKELPDILDNSQFLVMNNTRVFPARLRARRLGKEEEIEVLLIRERSEREWSALVKPARKTPLGQELILGDLKASVVDVTDSGSRILRFDRRPNLMQDIERIGEPPLPPYIRRTKGHDFSEDRLRYQTVYARYTGSVAAPTAGLHFTNNVMQHLKKKDIPVCEILLHVGYGTFQPVRCEKVEDHRMDAEYYHIDGVTLSKIRNYKTEGRRLIAVGTTTTRCLEFIARNNGLPDTTTEGECDLFIYPGFRFKMLDGLITNFHLPRSTLFMLVSAFAGRELMLDCYREAIKSNYRFYSYGDCMLIL